MGWLKRQSIPSKLLSISILTMNPNTTSTTSIDKSEGRVSVSFIVKKKIIINNATVLICQQSNPIEAKGDEDRVSYLLHHHRRSSNHFSNSITTKICWREFRSTTAIRIPFFFKAFRKVLST